MFFPAEGYKGNETKRYNADLRSKQAGLDWEQARSMLAEGHQRLVGFIDERSDADPYGGPMAPAKNHWTTGRWAEASGPSHYRSAAKYIRGWLRSMS